MEHGAQNKIFVNLPVTPENERQRLKLLNNVGVLDRPAEECFDRITRIAAQAFGCAHGVITFENADRLWHKSVLNFEALAGNYDNAFYAQTLCQNTPFVVEDTLKTPMFDEHPLVVNKPHIRFYAGIKLTNKDKQNVGSLCVLDSAVHSMSEQKLSVLTDLAKLVEDELDRQKVAMTSSSFSELRKEEKQRKKVSRVTNNILKKIACFDTLEPILHSLVENIELEYKDQMCSILLLDESLKHLTLGSAPSLPDFYNEAIEGVAIGIGQGSCGTAAFTGERVIVEDISKHPYWQQWKGLAADAGLGSCWSQPIKNSKDRVIGTFAIYQKQPSIPTKHEIEQIQQFAHLTSIAIERQLSNELIWLQANFDDLTKLPNRNIMKEYLKKSMVAAKRNQSKIALIFLDIDNFKDINDTLGHSAGDDLLIECAKRIKSVIREKDTVARLGGDEFIIILDDIFEFNGVEKTVQKILRTLAAPYRLQEQLIHSSASIGITVFPDDASDVDGLLKNADQAMYGAKSMGRNNYQYYTKSMRDAAMNRMRLIADLHQAIADKQFFIVYQPIVDMKTGAINKAEALIRWQHPERGIVGPIDFVPLAEETGLIIAISNWVFQQVCKDVKHWRNIANPGLQISINTSPIHYTDPERCIIEWLNGLLNSATPAGAVIIEITENLLMNAKPNVHNILLQFRQAGVEIALDDFGTGYSSISYLKKFPTDYLKIDQSFVHSMTEDNNDKVLCEAIIVMAQKLEIKVVAEGIETEEQCHILSQMGCEFGQGYLFSQPLKDKDFEKLLLQQNNPSEHI